MAAQWFAKVCGEVLGPMSSAELRELAERGAVQPDSLVRKGGDGSWVAAERVKGLFSAPEPRAAHPGPPPAPEWTPKPSPMPPPLPKHGSHKPVICAAGVAVLVFGGVFAFFVYKNAQSQTQPKPEAAAKPKVSPEPQSPKPSAAKSKQEFASQLEEARKAVRAMKRLQSRVEIGVSRSQYLELVGETWVEVRLFIEHREDYTYAGSVGSSLHEAMRQHRKALEYWEKYGSDKESDHIARTGLIKASWTLSKFDLKDAERHLKGMEDTMAKLERSSSGTTTP